MEAARVLDALRRTGGSRMKQRTWAIAAGALLLGGAIWLVRAASLGTRTRTARSEGPAVALEPESTSASALTSMQSSPADRAPVAADPPAVETRSPRVEVPSISDFASAGWISGRVLPAEVHRPSFEVV